MANLSKTEHASRLDLERAASAFFDQLAVDDDQPRGFDLDHLDEDLAFNVEMSRSRIRELDDQLRANLFSELVKGIAGRISLAAGADMAELSPADRLYVQQLAARAERENLELLVHRLTTPARPFVSYDDLFANLNPRSMRPIVETESVNGNASSLGSATVDYLGRKKALGVSNATIEELGRVLGWLRERLGSSRLLDAVTKDELRTFRDDLVRLNRKVRKKSVPFDDRFTADQSLRVTHYTAKRHWRAVLAFWDWALQEGHSPTDPAKGLKMPAPKGVSQQERVGFTTAELLDLFKSPLFAGYHSLKRLLQPGGVHKRRDHFWSALLPMFTGMRASEIAQILPEDFKFDGDVPYVKVRLTNDAGEVLKSAKTAASIRDVPLASPLIELGLREFVEARRKADNNARLFRGIRMGQNRPSDGLTKFWTRYLKAIGLWVPGRATHVWRHTVVACLRANGVAQEDIAALVGHAQGTVTAGYGGAYPIERKMKTAMSINYGFDVVSAAGGKFDPQKHS